MFFFHPVLRPAPDLGGERAGDVFGEAHYLAHFAHGAAGAVAHNCGAERGAVAAVMRVDPLDNVFTPLVLEIDIDIRRLMALGGNEALEQQGGFHRVDGGDAEHEADSGIGGRAAPLAEDAHAAGLADDGVDGQEIGRIAELGDERQFVTDLL